MENHNTLNIIHRAFAESSLKKERRLSTNYTPLEEAMKRSYSALPPITENGENSSKRSKRDVLKDITSAFTVTLEDSKPKMVAEQEKESPARKTEKLLQEISRRSIMKSPIIRHSHSNYVKILAESVRKSGMGIECESDTYVTVPGSITSGLKFENSRGTFGRIEPNLNRTTIISATEDFADITGFAPDEFSKPAYKNGSSITPLIHLEAISHFLGDERSESTPVPTGSFAPPELSRSTHPIETTDSFGMPITPRMNMVASHSIPIKTEEQLLNARLIDTQQKRKHQEKLLAQIQQLQSELKHKQKLVEKCGEAEIEETKLLQQELETEKEKSMRQRESIEGLTESVSLLEKQLESYEEQRKQMHRYIQQLRGNIRVFCRVKPLANPEACVVDFPELKAFHKTKPTTIEIGKESKAAYIYDRVFIPNATQSEVFEEVAPFLQSALDGEKVCIFAYGQTGSGKTYTMEGPAGDELYVSGQPTERSGVLPRAGHYIFQEIERLKAKGYEYSVTCSALEIYNEELRDLLQENPKEVLPQLAMGRNETEIRPLTWTAVSKTDALMSTIKAAAKNRKVEKTACNERSSRSHFIFQIRLLFESNAGKKGAGLLNIIDLAGSERAAKDSIVGKNEALMKEARHINQSLTTLGRVLTMLADRKASKKAAIPYRESKLTRVLQSSLQFESKTLMFVNICPMLENLAQSKESLRFASTASLAC